MMKDTVEGIHQVLMKDPYCSRWVAVVPKYSYEDPWGNAVCLNCFMTRQWLQHRAIGKYREKKKDRREIGVDMSKDFPKSVLGL